MRFLLRVLKSLDAVLCFVMLILFSMVGLFSFYALWDNAQVYADVDDIKNDLYYARPKETDTDHTPAFQDLLAVNPDIFAWITLDGTSIDYPIVQGLNNMQYLNTDIYGDFSLAGSIFMAAECKKDFSEPYTLLYGHHMENSRMFGDLDLYKNVDFMEKNHTGTLMTADNTYTLDIVACLLIPASEQQIFSPKGKRTDVQKLLTFIKEQAVTIRTQAFDLVKQQNDPQLMAMATCDSAFTDARCVVVAAITQKEDENKPEDV